MLVALCHRAVRPPHNLHGGVRSGTKQEQHGCCGVAGVVRPGLADVGVAQKAISHSLWSIVGSMDGRLSERHHTVPLCARSRACASWLTELGRQGDSTAATRDFTYTD